MADLTRRSFFGIPAALAVVVSMLALVLSRARSLTLSEIVTTTLRRHRVEVARNVMASNALLQGIKRRG